MRENRFLLDITGKEILLSDFSKKYNISRQAIYKRLKDNFSIKEIIETGGRPTRLRMLAYRETFKEKTELLDKLPEKCKLVLKLRYGLDDDKFRTLEEIGKELKLTRERIRQIESRGFKLFYKLL